MNTLETTENHIENSSSEVIQYLSKEIETAMNNATVFRSRISFAVFFGPFIILGSFVVAAKGLPISLNRDSWVNGAFIIMCACFLSLAYLAGRIEQNAWNQCNRWRKLIADLHDNPSLKIQSRTVWNQNKLQATYLAAYALLGIAFLGALFITSRVRVIPAPNASEHSIPTQAKSDSVLTTETVSGGSPKER